MQEASERLNTRDHFRDESFQTINGTILKKMKLRN